MKESNLHSEKQPRCCPGCPVALCTHGPPMLAQARDHLPKAGGRKALRETPHHPRRKCSSNIPFLTKTPQGVKKKFTFPILPILVHAYYINTKSHTSATCSCQSTYQELHSTLTACTLPTRIQNIEHGLDIKMNILPNMTFHESMAKRFRVIDHVFIQQRDDLVRSRVSRARRNARPISIPNPMRGDYKNAKVHKKEKKTP